MSIAVGKLLPYQMITRDDVAAAYLEEWFDKDYYNELVSDAAAFKKLKSEAEYPKFMVQREYSPEESVKGVTKEDVDFFKEEYVPVLRWIAKTNPDYEAWRVYMQGVEEDYALEVAEEAVGETTIADHIQYVGEDLVPLDFLFAALGVVTAFGLGKGKDEDGASDESAPYDRPVDRP